MSDREHYEQEHLWGTENVALPDHQQERLDAIVQLVPDAARTVLDIGAGDGRVVDALASRLPHLRAAAVERSFVALAHVEATRRVQGSIDALPFTDHAADLVLCCEVLEHLPGDVLDASVAELARIAGSHLILTVPNRERRARGDIVCAECRCRYNRDRHLRSFRAQDLDTLVPGFVVDEVLEVGPARPIYPRPIRTALERRGLLPVFGSPTCPQCGATYGPSARAGSTPGVDARGGGRYQRLRALVPKERHPYWLCARLRRR